MDTTLPASCSGLRLDQALAKVFSEHSRSFWQRHLAEGLVLVDGMEAQADDRCIGGELIHALVKAESDLADLPEDKPLDIVFEDDDILVVNKPSALTVHPGNGQPNGTLLNRLIFHRPKLLHVARAGIVHRLDKDTTGLMVITKNSATRLAMIHKIAKREVSREYLALVHGRLGLEVGEEGTINLPIGRHHKIRTRMAVVKPEAGKSAVTHYKTIKHFLLEGAVRYSLVHCRLQSGRTHQIRVHLAHLGCPLVGDNVYQGNKAQVRFCQDPLKLGKIMPLMPRQALHAFYLGFSHPQTANKISWQVPPPNDFQNVLEAL